MAFFDDLLATDEEEEEETSFFSDLAVEAPAPATPVNQSTPKSEGIVTSEAFKQSMAEGGAVPTSEISQYTGPLPGDRGMEETGFFEGMPALVEQGVLRNFVAPLVGIAEMGGMITEGTSNELKAEHARVQEAYLATNPSAARTVVAGLGDLAGEVVPLVAGGAGVKIGTKAFGLGTKAALRAGASEKVARRLGYVASGAVLPAAEGGIMALGEVPDAPLERKIVAATLGATIGGAMGAGGGYIAAGKASRLAGKWLARLPDDMPIAAKEGLVTGELSPKQAAEITLNEGGVPFEIDAAPIMTNMPAIEKADLPPATVLGQRESGGVHSLADDLADVDLRKKGVYELNDDIGPPDVVKRMRDSARNGTEVEVYRVDDGVSDVLPGAKVYLDKTQAVKAAEGVFDGTVRTLRTSPDQILPTTKKGSRDFYWSPTDAPTGLKTIRRDINEDFLHFKTSNLEAKEREIAEALVPDVSTFTRLKQSLGEKFKKWTMGKFVTHGHFRANARTFMPGTQARRFAEHTLPRSMEALREGKNAAMFRMNRNLDALNSGIRREAAASRRKGETMDVAIERIGTELAAAREAGNTTGGGARSVELQRAYNDAVVHVDQLTSEMVSQGVVNARQAETLKANLQKYMHMSYAKHDQPGYSDSVVDTAVWDDAFNFFQEEFGTKSQKRPDEQWSDTQVLANMLDIVTHREGSEFFTMMRDGVPRSDYGELKRRDLGRRTGERAEHVRKLMGQRVDMAEIYPKTVQKMIHSLVTTDYRRTLIRRGLETGVFSDKPDGIRHMEWEIDEAPGSKAYAEKAPADTRSVMQRGSNLRHKKTGKPAGKVTRYKKAPDGSTKVTVEAKNGSKVEYDMADMTSNSGKELRTTTDKKPKFQTVEAPGEFQPTKVYMDEGTYALFESLGRADKSPNALTFMGGLFKWGKIGYSWQTQMRNFWTGFIMGGLNGHVNPFASWKALKVAGDVIGQDVGGLASKTFLPKKLQGRVGKAAKGMHTRSAVEVENLYELGVISSGVSAGEMNRWNQDISGYMAKEGTAGGLIGSAAKKVIPETIRRRAKNANEATMLLYRLGDDVHKANAFYDERATIEWGLKGKNGGETLRLLRKQYDIPREVSDARAVDLIAAERVKQTMQNYDRLPEAVQDLSRYPLMGAFVSFKVEMPRNLLNNVKLIAENAALAAKSKNPRMMVLSTKRLSGIVMGLTALKGVEMAMKAVTEDGPSITDEQTEALRQTFLFDYAVNNHIVVTDFDKENKTVRYRDLQYLQPQSILDKVFRIMGRPVGQEERDEEGNLIAYTPGMTMAKKAGELVSELESEFLGWELLAGAIVEQVFNQEVQGSLLDTASGGGMGRQIRDPKAPWTEQAQSSFKALHRKLSPGGVLSAERLVKAATGAEGGRYDLQEELLAVAGFFRSTSARLDMGLQHRSYQFVDDKSAIAQSMNSAKRDFAKDQNMEKMNRRYGQADKEWRETWAEMQQHLNNARMLDGMFGEDELRSMMKGKVPAAYLDALMYNEPAPPWFQIQEIELTAAPLD